MGVLTEVGANRALDAMLGSSHGADWPATLDVGLSSTDPASSVTEPSGGGYARVSVANTDASWPDASGRAKSNATTVTFPTATVAWGVVGWFVLYAGTTLLAHGALDSAVSVDVGDTASFAAGALMVMVT